MKIRHHWANQSDNATFVKDKTDKNVCSVCGVHRKLIPQFGPGKYSYYVYYSFNIRETKLRPDCLEGNKDQTKLF